VIFTHPSSFSSRGQAHSKGTKRAEKLARATLRRYEHKCSVKDFKEPRRERIHASLMSTFEKKVWEKKQSSKKREVRGGGRGGGGGVRRPDHASSYWDGASIRLITRVPVNQEGKGRPAKGIGIEQTKEEKKRGGGKRLRFGPRPHRKKREW